MRSRNPVVGPIDWSLVYDRLARSTAALSGTDTMSPERAQAILDQRARALATVPIEPPSASEVLDVATFTLTDERYAIETRFVRRVVSRWECTPVPGSPDFLLGVTNLQGDVIPVYNLGTLLRVTRGPRTETPTLLVLGTDRDEMGIVADSVSEVIPLRLADVLDPPTSRDDLGHRYLRGVTEDALILLDGAIVLADDRLTIEQGEEPGA